MALTAHFNASDADNVFEEDTGSDTAEDGENINLWQDEDGADLAMWYASVAAGGPTYRINTPLMQFSCADFDGTSEFMGIYNNAGSSGKVMSDLFGASAKTAIFAVYVEGITLNDATVYNNDFLFGDEGPNFGIFFKNNAAPKVLAYNWDGNADSVELSISLNTSYVIMVRHDGSNLYMSLNGGAESSTASGATSTTSGRMFVGAKGPATATQFSSVRIGEYKLWNENLTGATLATAISYFTDKWTPAAGQPTSKRHGGVKYMALPGRHW